MLSDIFNYLTSFWFNLGQIHVIPLYINYNDSENVLKLFQQWRIFTTLTINA